LLGVVVGMLIIGVSSVLPWRSLAFAGIGIGSIVAAPDIFPNYLLIPAVALLPAACQLLARLHPSLSGPATPSANVG
jgi:hypothetical protein